MKIQKFFIAFSLLGFIQLHAQVHFRSICSNDDTLVIGVRIGDKIFSKDTLVGKGDHDISLDAGMYAIVKNGNLIGDFILRNSKEPLRVMLDCDSIVSFDSKYNDVFKKFVRTPDNDKIRFFESLEQHSKDILIWCYPQLAFVSSQTSEYKTNFQLNEFFKTYLINSTPFLQNSPFFEMNLEYYFSNLISPDRDTLLKYIPKLEAVLDSDGLAYFRRWALYRFETSKVLGHENVFIDLASRYLTGSAVIFDSTTDFNVRLKAKNLMPNRIGTVVNDFSVELVNGLRTNIMSLDGIYKVFYFFDPDCHHCRESFPSLKEFADKFHDYGVRVFAISVGVDKEELSKFIYDFGTPEKVVFASDNDVSKVTFRNLYHIPSTPTIYVVRGNGECLARGISSSELSRLFEQIINN